MLTSGLSSIDSVYPQIHGGSARLRLVLVCCSSTTGGVLALACNVRFDLRTIVLDVSNPFTSPVGASNSAAAEAFGVDGHWLSDLDASGWAWEWLRRDPHYRSVFQAHGATLGNMEASPARWGLHFRRGAGSTRVRRDYPVPGGNGCLRSARYRRAAQVRASVIRSFHCRLSYRPDRRRQWLSPHGVA